MKTYTGSHASGGLALGKVVLLKRGATYQGRAVQNPEQELLNVRSAITQAKRELSDLLDFNEGPEKDIFLFQKALLEDETLMDEVAAYIRVGAGSAAAVERASQIFAKEFSDIPDEYLSLRSADVRDACRRVVDILDGRPRDILISEEPVILAAESFFPSDIVGVGRETILGLAVAQGSEQSHAAIIARSLGIPMVLQLGDDFLDECDGKLATLDADRCELTLDPDPDKLAAIRRRMDILSLRENWDRSHVGDACITRDGTEIRLLASTASPENISDAVQAGAHEIGLLRSEFMLNQNTVPDEDEQYWYYRRCLAMARGRMMTIRTFDFGSDKRPAGFPESGKNPALGLRGFRCTVAMSRLQRDQLCALLRTSVVGNLQIAFPMVTCLEDWQACQHLLEEAKASLRMRGTPFDENPRVGIVIDTPAGALCAEELALSGANFFMISASDLAQYTYAADRMNVHVQRFYRPRGRAMMRLFRMALESGRRHGLSVRICGIGLSDSKLAEQYVRAGARELVLSARLIPEVCRHLRRIDLRE